MPELNELISDDSRTVLEKCKRRELELIAAHMNLNFVHGGPASDLRKVIEGSGVTLDDVKAAIKWETIHVKQDDGSVLPVDYPVRKPHATAAKEINHASIIEERAKAHEEAITDKDSEIETLKKMVAAMSAQLSQIQGTKNSDEHWPEQRHLIHINTLKKKCRELGISVTKTDKKVDVLEKLDGYFASRSEQSSTSSEHLNG